MHYSDPLILNKYSDYETIISEQEKYINSLNKHKILFNELYQRGNKIKVISDNNVNDINTSLSIAVIIKISHVELIDELVENLKFIPYKFVCFVLIDTDDKFNDVQDEFNIQKIKNLCELKIELYINKHTGIVSFPENIQHRINNNDYFCYMDLDETILHDYGKDWRRYIYRHLLGSENNIAGIINVFETNLNAGIVSPECYPIHKMNNESCSNTVMFWARSSVASGYLSSEIPLTNFIQESGYSCIKTFNNCITHLKSDAKKRITLFVHYDHNNIISDQDIMLVKNLAKLSTELIFISNCTLLPDNEVKKIKIFTEDILLRENKGYDFGAWRDALIGYGFENLAKFDQLLIVNNSIIGPVYDLGRVFAEMDSRKVDFWGITIHPEMYNSVHLSKDVVAEHIQSYFMVFEKNVFLSKEFQRFWENVEDLLLQDEVIAKYETELTALLKSFNYDYSIYIPETLYLNPYIYPYYLLILGSPFIKKKAYLHSDCNEMTQSIKVMSQLI